MVTLSPAALVSSCGARSSITLQAIVESTLDLRCARASRHPAQRESDGVHNWNRYSFIVPSVSIRWMTQVTFHAL